MEASWALEALVEYQNAIIIDILDDRVLEWYGKDRGGTQFCGYIFRSYLVAAEIAYNNNGIFVAADHLWSRNKYQWTQDPNDFWNVEAQEWEFYIQHFFW